MRSDQCCKDHPGLVIEPSEDLRSESGLSKDERKEVGYILLERTSDDGIAQGLGCLCKVDNLAIMFDTRMTSGRLQSVGAT